MKKIKIFSTLALLVSMLGLGGSAISAQDTATETKTDLNVTISDSEGPVKPDEEWDSENPDKPGVVDPGEDEGSKPNPEIGDAKLGIWRIPSDMQFNGKMDYAKNYSLALDGTNQQRVISIADVRAEKDTNWQLSGALTKLTSNGGEELTSGYSLKLGKVEPKKHKVEGNKLYAKQFVNDANGVVAPASLQLDTVAKEVARAENGKGKGYTGILFNDISLDFDAGVGSVDSYSGQVIWTLSDTIN